MERQLITIEKRIYKVGEHHYNLYLIPEVQDGEEVIMCLSGKQTPKFVFLTSLMSKTYLAKFRLQKIF